MTAHLLRRCAAALATGLGIAVVSFLVLYAFPDKALAVHVDRAGDVNAARIEAMRERLGLDRPLAVQFLEWAAGCTRGDLGESWSRPGMPVARVIAEHLPLTLGLTGSGLVLQLVLGVALAALSILRRGSWPELLSGAGSLALNAMPEFCLALLLQWILAVQLGWFPISGVFDTPWEPPSEAIAWFAEGLHHLALPALALGLGGAALVARLLRVRWEEELADRSIVAALARGSTIGRVVWRHALPRAAGPLCTAIGLSLPALIGGAVVIERVFDWPGLGTVLVDAVAERDLPLLAGVNLIFAVLVAVGGLLSDLMWGALDPRARSR